MGTLEKENMILLSESTKKQSQLFFLLTYGNFLFCLFAYVIQLGIEACMNELLYGMMYHTAEKILCMHCPAHTDIHSMKLG